MSVFKHLFKRPIRRLPSIDTLNLDQLPVLSADQLITLLAQQNQITQIRDKTALSPADFARIYRPAIDAFCECAQLIPASASYHHTQPGGLIIHTLSVVEHALHYRSQYILPLFSDPDVQAAQRHVWSYAVFVGALLHDAGKLLTQQYIELTDGKQWTAYAGSLIDSEQHSYRIRFRQDAMNWKLHQQLASSFLYLIPQRERHWLAQHIHVLAELIAWLSGDQDHWGSIGAICRQADSRSVADSLGMYNAIRFPGALPPLGEKLMTALRQILSTFGVNKPGAAIWKQGASTWVMSKTMADSIREHLKSNGESAVPVDNTRIFDELGQFGDMAHCDYQSRWAF